MRKKKNKSQVDLIKELPERFNILLLVIITTFGFYLRISNVGDISLWVDEYVHVLRAKNLVEGTGPLLTNDNNGILYTIFMVPLFYLFDSSEFWSRLPSVLFGTGSIYVVYLLARQLFNKNVGIITSALVTISLYNVYWSRISRNYAIFMFFYLLVLLFFVKGFERKEEQNSTSIFKRNGIDVKYVIFFGIAFILSLLSHQLTFLFIFSAAVYFIAGEVMSMFDRKSHVYKNKYFALALFSTIALSLIFLPFAGSMVKGILGQFLPEKIVTWVIPDWTLLAKYYKETPFQIFKMYFGVLQNDFPILYWVGILGIPVTLFVNKKGGIFIISMLVIPFVLMSFVFKDPSLPRYLIFIYPLFLMSIAVLLHFVIDQIYKRLFASDNKVKFAIITYVLPIIVIMFFIQSKELKSLVKAEKKQGFIIDRSLSSWSFTNWKYPSRYVKTNMKEGDLIISTVPPATKYYLDIDSCIQFRQRYYDTVEKKYKNFEPHQFRKPNANSVEDIKDILLNYERGWLLADYYFYNVMTDPRARSLVCRYMDYHPQGTKDGGVLVFSWDKRNPQPVKNQTMIYVLAVLS